VNYKIRKSKTISGKIAVQVYHIVDRKRKILKHLGSGANELEVNLLIEQAQNWITENTKQLSLFGREQDSYFSHYKYIGFSYNYAHEFLYEVISKFNLQNHLNPLLVDLVICQILEPSSKRQHLIHLEKYFGKKYNLNRLYKTLSNFDDSLKQIIELEVIAIAKQEFQFDFSFLFYDVTTLYFESFKNDEFRKPGFSKDNKHNQPQIVIGLVVTKEGFPVHYEVFTGNTFEGKTFLPSIEGFKAKHNIETLTVVADGAMLSKQNLENLVRSNINYIVAARLSSIKEEVLKVIDTKLQRTDGEYIRVDDLIVEYREKRFTKDLKEMEKQVAKAAHFEGKKTTKQTKLKFLKNDTVTFSLNTDLIEKNKKLLGLKGYVTNLTLDEKEIIHYYHNLVRVEHAFRVAKSDLEIRPIYHFKENSIKNHILICFMSLAISVFLEQKNNRSINSIVKILKDVTDARILNRKTGKILLDRSDISEPLLH
jgi:transposase